LYGFQDKLKEGQAGERFLDGYFERWFNITPATATQQRRGIDRIFNDRTRDRTLRIEYKTDKTAARTHNAFVEVVSVDTENKPGWAYTSQADYLMYYIPGDDIVYVIRFDILREQLPRWADEYETRHVKNDGYNTIGIPVPLWEFEAISEAQVSV